jgi:hypothetical protein
MRRRVFLVSLIHLFDPIKTALRLIKKKNSVVFFPGFLPPLFSLEPYVFTIHDLNHLDRQDNSSFLKSFIISSLSAVVQNRNLFLLFQNFLNRE